MIESIIGVIFSPQVVFSICVLIAAGVLWHMIRKGEIAYMQRKNSQGHGARQSAISRICMDIIKYGIVAGTVLLILQLNGVNVTSLIAGLGLVSAIVGLALQDVLKDTIMGIHMVTDHFFEVGDVVRYGNFEGIVISFNMKTTKLRSIYDNSVMTICNRNISEIVKLSDWLDIDLPLSYEEDRKKVNGVLEKCCTRIRAAEGIEDCLYKGVQEFADSAVLYKIRLVCRPEKKPELRRMALGILQEELEKAMITIPYPQMDVHSKK